VLDAEHVVVNAEDVEHRGVEITHVHDIFNGEVAEIIGLAMTDSSANTPSSKPHAEGLDVVIAPHAPLALIHRRAAKLATPDDERVVEHAAALEVREEGPGRTVGQSAANVHVLDEAAVVIPPAVVELDEAHTAFGEPSRQEAIRCVRAVSRSGAVHVENLARLIGDIHELGD
jgi:hypothetical protein